MPKTRGRRGARSTNTQMATRENSSPITTAGVVHASAAKHVYTTGASGAASLFMPIMVVLGCWGLAVFFAVFSTEPNRLLFAGMAVLMALMWSFSLGLRLRKMMQRK
ncbi:MAG: hypothetical protein JO125_01340 [Chloroflexi bacterium]|nr:hypothetical protein [Ktedonobacteraceae bacterium]MBV8823073.1 hypothetical protein [Ktedonobacteraceae bacterium]MBV9706033.1 hypothetical protein [Chloroflexota bacterium]